jgi:hypothetical protein
MPFVSIKQEKWAFATKQPWARKWAKQTDESTLPDYVSSKKKEKPRSKSSLERAILGHK